MISASVYVLLFFFFLFGFDSLILQLKNPPTKRLTQTNTEQNNIEV